jgi:hypothetical protein
MTRRLGSIRRKGFAALVSVSLAAALAGGGALIGCGGDTTSNNNGDGGEGGLFDGMVPEGGMDATMDALPDTFVGDTFMGDTFVGPTLAAPTFTPPAGAIASGTNVTIACAMLPATGFIFYTTDGTLPTHASKAYSGPIQITAAETIHAVCSGPGFNDSPVGTAAYTIAPVDAGPNPTAAIPIFTPTSQTLDNDQAISLDGKGALICYTADGTTPTCAAGVCGANSKQYNATTGVPLNGTVTNPTTGVVTISALSCGPNLTNSAVASQQYTLKVGTPAMSVPAPGTIAYKTGGATPTIASITNPTGTSVVTIRYTTDGSMPSCIIGTAVGNPSTIAIAATTTINAVGCKTGYAASAVFTATYTVQLNAPSLTAATFLNPPGTYDQGVTPGPFVEPNAGLADWLCYTIDGKAPTCGATASTCGANEPAAIATTASLPAIAATGTVVNVLSCMPAAAGYVPSAVATGTYVLQLAPPYLNPPGTTNAVPANPNGTPLTSFAIPANMVGALNPNVAETDPGATGTNQSYSFVCAMKGGTPACGNGACTTGTQVAFASRAAMSPILASGSVAAGDSWQVIGCPASAAFLASKVTTVTFSGPGGALAPSVTPASGPFSTTKAPTITNTDANTVTVCYTTDGTTPGCANAACTGGTTTQVLAVTGAGASAVSAVTLASGGSGYTTAPGVTFSGGGGTTQAGASTTLKITGVNITAGGSGYTSPPAVTFSDLGGTPGTVATGSAILTGGSLTGITITGAGAGYKSPVITVAAPPAGGTQATATPTGSVDAITLAAGGAGYSSAPTVTIAGNATATAVTSNMVLSTPALGSNMGNNVLMATVCNASETAPAPVSVTYTFNEAEPDFTSAAGVVSGATGDLNAATSIGGGQTITVSTASNFAGQTLHCNTGTTSATTATCGSPACAAPITVPTTATSFSVSAIACGSTTATQNTSAVRTVTYAVGTAAPTITTNQVVAAALAGCHLAPCPAQTTWFNTFNAVISTATTGATVCYSTSGTPPTCGSGGACASGMSATTTTGNIPVTVSGTQLQAVACSATLGNSAALTPMTFTLQVSPAAFTAPPLACGGSVSISLDTSNTTQGLGGPTPGASICYTTDGVTAPGCTAGGAVTCVANGALPAVTAALSTNTTVKAQTCQTNFSGTTGSQAYTFTPYSHTISPIDGTVGNFTVASEQVSASTCGGACAPSAQHGWLTYDATNVYVGVDNVPAAPPMTAGHLPPWYVVVYFGTGGAGGASKDLDLFKGGININRTISAGANIQWALLWNTANSGAPVWYQWSTGAWVQQASFPGSVGVAAASTADFSVPRSAIGSPSTLYVVGAVMSNTAAAGQATEEFRFPSIVAASNTNANYDAFFSDVLSSCSNPNAQTTSF